MSSKPIIEAAPRRVVSSVTIYETGIVLLRRRGPDGLDDVSALIEAFDFEVVATDRTFSDAALEAYARFGKGIDSNAHGVQHADFEKLGIAFSRKRERARDAASAYPDCSS